MFASLNATTARIRIGRCSKLLLSTGSSVGVVCSAGAKLRRSYHNDRRSRYDRNNTQVAGKAPTPSHGNPVKLKFRTKGSSGIEITNTKMELIYGFSPIKAAMTQGRREVYGLYYQGGFMGDEPRSEMDELIEMAQSQLLPVKCVSRSDMDNATYGANHQGVLLKVSRMEATRVHNLGPLVNGRYTLDLATGEVELEPRRKFPLLVCLDGIQDERNLGSIIRSALFFGADGVLMSGKGACRPSPIVSKTSSGAMECLNIYRVVEAPKVLAKARKNGWSVVCATVVDADSGKSVPLQRIPELSAPTFLVLGSEGEGVSQDILCLSDMNIHIPARADIPSYIDSLNVGVAAGVILSALRFAGE
ncbi:Ribose methyltransferase [Coemansia sp. RSA 2050]|nr:Ribose methyltransferase [Coemansia sp. RSA 2050]KAJ2736210.1 Ribose methyltransferase [Coemansia sp. BCRC 34962]